MTLETSQLNDSHSRVPPPPLTRGTQLHNAVRDRKANPLGNPREPTTKFPLPDSPSVCSSGLSNARRFYRHKRGCTPNCRFCNDAGPTTNTTVEAFSIVVFFSSCGWSSNFRRNISPTFSHPGSGGVRRGSNQTRFNAWNNEVKTPIGV